MTNPNDLFRLLLQRGGAIVRTWELSPKETATARAEGHIFVDGEGNSFAWVPRRDEAKKSVGFGT